MANYGNYGNRSYGGGRASNNSYGGRQYNQAPPPQEPFDLDAFINERLDIYNAFVDAIKARGGEPSDYVFALGGWVTSAVLEQRKK